MNKKDIKIIFIGSADFSLPILKMLIDNYAVVLTITEEDKPAGRGKKVLAPPTKKMAQEAGIELLQPEKVKNNEELFNKIRSLNPNLIIVAAYGKILPNEILNINQFGCLNVHPSLLPKYRGPSPIQTALFNGDDKTGVSIMRLTAQMDAGPILAQREITLTGLEKYSDLEKKIAEESARLLDANLIPYLSNELSLQEQNENEVSFCTKIVKTDGRINFNDTALNVFNKFRAFHKWPGLYCFYKKQKLDLIDMKKTTVTNNGLPGVVFKQEGHYFVNCNDSALEIIKVKLESKKETDVSNFVNGHQDFIGTTLE